MIKKILLNYLSYFKPYNFPIQLNHVITKIIQVTFLERTMLTIGGHIHLNRVT